MSKIPGIDGILKARERIRPYIRHTPLLQSGKMEGRLGCKVYLKPEMLQITGAFKLRGALNRSLLLTPEEREKGVIASSSGNHAQALAYASKLLGMKAVLVVPRNAPKLKVDSTRALGAEVILFEPEAAARWAHVDQLVAEHGYINVHPYNDPDVMEGQGTIALEILEDLPEVDTVVVPMGGGGLISGISTAIKARNPNIRVIGAETAAAPLYHECRKLGKAVPVPTGDTFADGIKAPLPGENCFPVIERCVDEIVLVEDKYIAGGMRMLADTEKLIAEGAAAVGLGALLGGAFRVTPSEKVCFVLSGGNWGLEQYFAVINQYKDEEGNAE